MKFSIGQRVWVMKPPTFSGGKPCILRFKPKWGTIIQDDATKDRRYLVDTGRKKDQHRTTGALNSAPGRIQWWYFPTDLEDPFLTCCREAREEKE